MARKSSTLSVLKPVILVYSVIFLISSLVHTDASCPHLCNGHGRCENPGLECDCYKGYTGADCSLLICPHSNAWVDQAVGVDKAHQPAECSNMGKCDRSTGKCECREGFEGEACERKICPNHCNSRGTCKSMMYYAESKDPGRGSVYMYEDVWDANKIQGCDCDPQYHGTDCSLYYCPRGDDPLTGTMHIENDPANEDYNPEQFNEIQRVRCRADSGGFTLTYLGKTSAVIPYNSLQEDVQKYIQNIETIGEGGAKVTMGGPQACSAGESFFDVEFKHDMGDLSKMIPDDRRLELAVGKSLEVTKQVTGTKENAECSNRGICDTVTGVCTCARSYDTSNGYNEFGARGDCGYTTDTIGYCPGDIACSSHGKCSQFPSYKCECNNGWTGADCSEMLCPHDLSWFSYPSANNVAHVATYAECSNAGICDRTTGECLCDIAFTGAACNRLTCPTQSIDSEACSGHGRCLDMSELAVLAKVNGELAGYTYGTIPHDANTWDYNRIFGCLCDEQFEGFDCSLHSCPFGDNIDTPGQVDEEQLISCTDDDGKGEIVIKFREEITTILSPTATTAEVKEKLEELKTIDEVSVEVYVDGNEDKICTSAGNQFLVTFKIQHGDLPLMKFNTVDIPNFEIHQHKAGNKENVECSDRGLCNHETGVCECFPGYGSSDGKGQEGARGDCGYREPYQGNF